MAGAAESPQGSRPLLRKAVAVAAFLFVLVVLAGVAFQSTRLVRWDAAGGRTGRYNVLLITVDTLRADHVGCYGDSRASTPFMDHLAAEGVLFERAETAVPITLPAHASILTGTYPAFHGVRNNGTYRLGPRAETLPEVLKQHGYRTGAVISGYPLVTRYGLSQGFDTYDDHLPPEQERQIGFRERSAEEVSQAGIAWLEAGAGQRFFLWLHYFDPHAPYSPPSPYAERFSRSPYDGEVAYVDAEMGRVLERLRQMGLAERTLVVLVSDHGEGLGDHGEATHGVFLYESTLRVPMILSLPGPLPRGRRVATPVRTIDLMPTVLRLVDLPEPDELQGTSLLPLVSRRPPDLLLKSVSETLLPRENYGWSEMASLRIGDWKYILAPREELYDLRTDPGETNNLAEKREGDLARMREETHRLLAEAAPTGASIAYRQELDETARERLRSLGYLWAPGPSREAPSADPKDRLPILEALDGASLLYARGDFAGAIAKFGEVLAADPGNLTALFHRGNARVEAGDPSGAAADFEAVLVQRPRSPEVLVNLGMAQLGQGLLNESARTFRQVLELDPDSDKACAGLGLVLARQGKQAEAVEAFQKALAFNPASREAQQGLAAAQAAGGQTEQAEATYRRALEEHPADARAALALARILYESRRYDDVEALMERTLRAGADLPDIHFALGNAHFQKGEIAQASEEYARVLRARPEDAGALFGSALVALKGGRTSEAIRLLERARNSDPSSAAARRNLGILYDEGGKDLAAIEEYRFVLSLDPSDREIRFHLGRVYARAGRKEEAAEQFRACLAGGDGEFAEEARRELSRLGGT
jgi:arylsulfatase A-like enzyme/Flp pilus assembly protein TadD